MPLGAVLGGIAAVGSIGGSIISGSKTASQQRKASNLAGNAVDELKGVRDDFLASDPYKAFTALLSQYAQDPYTFDATDVANMKARAANEVHQGARNATMTAWERAGAVGGYRDGSTRAVEGRIGQQVGARLGDISRQIDTDAARQRIDDIARFGSLLQGYLQLRSAPSQNLANAYQGVAQQIAGYNASPFGDALKGVGTLATAIGSAPNSKGGTLFGDLFKG